MSKEEKVFQKTQLKYCHYFTQKQITIILVLTTFLIAAADTLPPILINVLAKSDVSTSSTYATTSICSKTTCISYVTPLFHSSATRVYQFDGNAYDLTQTDIGNLHSINVLPSFYDRAIAGQSIYVIPASKQYIEIPHIDFSSKSFTIEFWIAPYWSNDYSADYGIFGQCDLNGTGIDPCLSINIRNSRLRFSFDSMDSTNLLTYCSRFWINGSLFNITTTGVSTYAFIPPYYVTLGNINSGTGISVTTCSANSLPIETSAYSGAIDDFRLYQRELDRDEICVLSGN